MRLLALPLLLAPALAAQPVLPPIESAALPLLLAPALAAQPVLPPIESAALPLGPDAAIVLAAPADWEPPPGLYWAGVGLDVAFVAAGAFLVFQGLRWMAASAEAGLGGIPAVMLGGVAVGTGAGIGVVFGYDLVRVVAGDDPLLARLFDPTRLPDGTPLPPRTEALPRPPPGLPPADG